VLGVALHGCAPESPPGTVIYASGADLQSINPLLTTHPLAKQVQRHMLFLTLARYDSSLAPEPYLAERWSWSEDRRRLTFRLRPGVRWHDGAPTTADDVVFTLTAARHPATGYTRAADLACLLEVRKSGDGAVSLTFCRPQDALPDVLVELPILPAHRLGGLSGPAMRGAPFNASPVGNGPFRFVSRQAGRRWVFEANREFPAALGGPPGVSRVVIVVVDEPTTKLAGLVSGELDVAGILPSHAALVRRAPGLAVVSYPILLSYGIVWNTAREPLSDARLRRALTMALDREQLVAAYLYGFGEVAHGPVPPAHPRFAPVERVPYDRARAESELEALGWRRGPDGVRVREARRLSLTLTTVGSADNVLEQLIQADLAAVGVEVAIRQLELGAFLQAAQGERRDYDALVTGISGDLTLGYLGSLFDSRRRSGPLQYAQYASPAVDSALDRGDWQLVQRLVGREVPITFLYHARGLQGVSGRLKGVVMDLRGELATVSRWHLAARAAGR
jgi:peptide/nickel transport system substrate-binding protein